jgi:hypothetical protein
MNSIILITTLLLLDFGSGSVLQRFKRQFNEDLPTYGQQQQQQVQAQPPQELPSYGPQRPSGKIILFTLIQVMPLSVTRCNDL